jgi:plasmid maintenance system antidote protein VapI
VCGAVTVHGVLSRCDAGDRQLCQTLYDILDEKQPVTPAMALRLGKLFGNGPEFWLNLQRDHDLRTLEPKMREELATIETVAA